MQAHYTGDTPHRVWLDLDNSLTRWKRPIFKIPFSQNSKNSVWKSNFFAGHAIPQILFALHCHYTVETQYRIWFDLDNSLTQWKKNYFQNLQEFAIREIRKIPYENPFFPRQALPFFFALHSHQTGDAPYRVWFDLDNSLTRWKRPFFKILFFLRNSKSSVCNTNFFSGHGIPKIFFLLYTLITLVILNTEFGLIWTTPWPDENEIFLKLSKIRNSPNSQNSVWKPIFSLGKLYKQLFCFASSLHWLYSTPCLVRFGQLLNPVKKTYF